MKIDIKTKFIANNLRVVVARPGANYRLFNEFVNFNVVGPELPGLFLQGEKVDSNDPKMFARIRRSKEVRRWIANGRNAQNPPDVDLNHYDDAGGSDISQFVRLTDFYLVTAKKGDLIAIPPKNFGGKVHIGEFTTDPNGVQNSTMEAFGEFRIPVRPVKWLGTIDKIDLPARIIDALRKPTALLGVAASERHIFHGAAYRNYYTSERYCSVFDVTSADFDTTSGSIIPAFFNFVAANTEAIDKEFGQIFSFGEGAFKDLGEYAPELAIDIQSPGILSLASRYISPLVASALLAIALSVGPSAADPLILAQVQITNSMGAPDDPCVVLVKKHVSTHIKLLGYDRWAEACVLLKKTKDATGLESETTVGK